MAQLRVVHDYRKTQSAEYCINYQRRGTARCAPFFLLSFYEASAMSDKDHKQSATEQEAHKCQTIFIDQVFPSMVNHYGTLFGGIALQWMDKAAWVICTRHARLTMVTVAVDQIIFKNPIPQGSMVELRARIERVGNTSITAFVEMYCESPLTGAQQLATTGKFVMVGLDEDGNPSKIRRN